jgi:AcrR family transcriptional regulator
VTSPPAVSPPAAPGRRKRRRSGRAELTRQNLLEAAEAVFAEEGFYNASMVKITGRAGVAQGTFYLYFSSKQQIFEELVDDLNRRVRQTMAAAIAGTTTRLEAERAGLTAFAKFTAEHPSLYRIIHQADIVAPEAMKRHYDRLAGPYAIGLRRAMDAGEIARADPEVLAWALMSVAEMIGRRWVLWGDQGEVPDDVIEETMRFIGRALGAGQAAEPEDAT